MVGPKVGKPGQGCQRQAAQVGGTASAQLPQPAPAQVQHRQHGHPGQVKAQHRVFQQQRTAAQKTLQGYGAQRHLFVGCQALDQPVQGGGQKGQQQFLGTAAVGEGPAGRQGCRRHQAPDWVQGFAAQ